MKESYRASHLHKGEDYHATFSTHPHRAMMWRIEQRLLTRVVRRRFAGRRPTHLDFACGTGRILAHLAPLVRDPVGIDVSAAMLAVARQDSPTAEILEADLTRVDPLKGRKFDLITAFRFFPNAEPELRAAVIRELARHLAPGGCLVLNNHQNAGSLLLRVVGVLGRLPPEEETAKRSQRSMSEREVLDLVGDAGLKVVSRHAVATLPFTDRHMPWPARLLEWIERGISALPVASTLAQNVIYVCADAAAGADSTQ